MESLIRLNSRLTLLIILMLSSTLSFGQTWEELFKQRKTQLRYSLQQIAALKIYAGYLKEGYDITSTGLKTVKDITSGEFNLHSLFINSLKTVSPVIRKDARIVEIVALQIEIRKAFSNPYNNHFLSSSNQTYVAEVKEKVMEECEADLDELMLIVTSGKIEMKDNERLKRLDKVYASMKDKAQFAQSFIAKVSLLARLKENEHESVNQLMKYYEKD